MATSRFRLLFGLLAAFATLAALPATAQQPAQPDGSAADTEGLPPSLREQTVYIPYTKLRETFEKEGRGVFLPYEKFQELWNAAREKQQPQPPDRLPARTVITEIDNEATVKEGVVRVEARLKIDLLAEGWNVIPLRLADAAVLSAKIGNQPARLVSDPKSGHKLLIEKEGAKPEQVELRLEYAKSFSKAPGRNSVSFQAPFAPVNRWRIRIPEAGVKVNVHPLLAATEAPAAEEGAADGETVVLAFLGAAPEVRIDWTPKAEGASGLEALASVRVEQTVIVDEGVVRTTAQLTYEIARAELTTLTVEVPADQKVASVYDANVRRWEVAAQDDVQRITVELFEPARKTQRLSIELEEFRDDADQAKLVAPVVKAVGVGRQQGLVLVGLAEGLRAEAVRRSGLLQMDAEEIPKGLRRRHWDFSYRYAALPFELALAVEKVQPRIQVDQLVEAYVEPEKLTLDLLALYTIERAGVFELLFDVPAGYEVRQVKGHAAAGAKAAEVDVYHQTGENNTRLRVNLSRKAMGRVGLMIELERRLDDPNLLSPTGKAADLALDLPGAAPDGLQRATGRLVVYAPERLRINPLEHEGLQSVSFEDALKDTASTRGNRFPGLRPVLAFAYSDSPAAPTIAAERRKPQVTARQLLVARIDSGTVKYEATLFYEVRYSAVQSLRLDVPAELASTIRIETPSIRKQQMDAAEGEAAGYATWNLSRDTEWLGDGQIRLTWEQPIEQLDVGKSMDLEVPRLKPGDVDRAWGQIVVVKAETIDVVPAGKPEGLRPIDPQHELMAGASVSDAAQAFEFHNDWDLALTATRYQLEEVKRTSIERAVLRMVATRSDTLSVQALYRMRSARQRLRLMLPDDVADGKIAFDREPLRINGRPVTLERGGDKRTFYVPLVGLPSGEPFVLELRYESPGSASRIEFPVFPDDPAVQKVYLCAYLPEELAYLGSRGPWTDEVSWHRRGFFAWTPQAEPGRDARLIEWLTEKVKLERNPAETFATEGTLYVYSTLQPAAPEQAALRMTTLSEGWLNALVFAVVVAVGIALVGRRSGERFLALAALVVLLILMGAFLPTLSRQVIDGVLISAVFVVLVVWLALYVGRDRPRRRATAAATAAVAAAAAAGPQAGLPPTPPAAVRAAAQTAPDTTAESPPTAEAVEEPDGESPEKPAGEQPSEGGESDA